MKILRATFLTSAAAGGSGGVVRDAIAQFAFVGRSNVGKSTLLNALMRTPLARTSAAAGKTRTTNTYLVELEGGAGRTGRWACYLVDLPGYGYARGGADAATELAAVAAKYFEQWRERQVQSRAGGGVFLLVDARHPGLDLDRQAYAWLSAVVGAPRVLATKVDKLTRAERTRNLRELDEIFGSAPMPVSAHSGEGVAEIWSTMSSLTR